MKNPSRMIKNSKMLQCASCKFPKDRLIPMPGDKCMCERCAYLFTLGIHELPNKSLYCFKCKEPPLHVQVNYKGATVVFSLLQDRLKVLSVPMYGAVKTTGRWRKGLVPCSAECYKCKSTIQLFQLENNPSLNSIHTNDPGNTTA